MLTSYHSTNTTNPDEIIMTENILDELNERVDVQIATNNAVLGNLEDETMQRSWPKNPLIHGGIEVVNDSLGESSNG